MKAYRGKSIETGMWHKGSYREDLSMIESTCTDLDGKLVSTENVVVDPVTVSQYIGGVDRDNNDIFEGDIVTDKRGNYGVVKWNNIMFDYRIYFFNTLNEELNSIHGIPVKEYNRFRNYSKDYKNIVDVRLHGIFVCGNIHDCHNYKEHFKYRETFNE